MRAVVKKIMSRHRAGTCGLTSASRKQGICIFLAGMQNPFKFPVDHAGPASGWFQSRRLVAGCQAVLACWLFVGFAFAIDLADLAGQGEIALPQPSADYRIYIDANQITGWSLGAWDVLHLDGNVVMRQGENTYQSTEAIVWADSSVPEGSPRDVLVFLSGAACVNFAPIPSAGGGASGNRLEDTEWFGRLKTVAQLQLSKTAILLPDGERPPVFARAMARREEELGQVQAVQYIAPQSSGDLSLISPLNGGIQPAFRPAQVPAGGSGGFVVPRNDLLPNTASRRTQVQILPRNTDLGGNVKGGRKGDLPGEEIITSTGGTRVVIDSEDLARLNMPNAPQTTRLVIQADNVVAWQTPLVHADGTTGSRWEIYLEGDVIFAMGNRVIYADRMYYDTTWQRGTILNADVVTPVPSYEGLLRLKADVVQQTGEDQFQAFGAAVTSSRLGIPRYWLQSDSINLTGQDRMITDPASGLPLVDPSSGQVGTGKRYFVEAESNRVYVGGVPVIFWPRFRTDLDNPGYYIERIRVGSDSVFGTQLGVGLDLFQVFGIENRPEDADWIGLVDYLSERGIGVGTEGNYRSNYFAGLPGTARGMFRAWGISDSGLDNLGRDRRTVPLESDIRGRLLMRHRQTFEPGFSLRGEIGYISDRNFLEQYYEREWDNEKDFTTGLWLERNLGNQSLNVIADARVNDFFTQTQWLPRLDHYILGQPFLFDRAVWHGHSMVGYGQFRTADAPTNPVDLAKWDPLAWEGVDREGVVAGTRHEIDFPIQAGPVKVVPYLLGDASFWQQDLDGNDYLRAYGQAGIRTSLPLWRVDPSVQSTLLYLNGLAHKVTWDSELLYADASQNLDQLPLYNPLDDDAQEAFRRRFAFDSFGLMAGQNVPLQFDERYFAHRYGLQSYVTSPVSEIADDLMVWRTGFRNRWQTKRGIPGNSRIVDVVTLDVFASYFPKADRDNFGEDVGVIDYDFEWFIGDRLSLVSDGYFDVFSQGLRTASVGLNTGRPGLGDIYLGIRSIEGPISSNILTAALTYRMSDKWIIQGSNSIDFGSTGNIGQSFSLVRVGESFLIRAGVNTDISRDNVSFVFGIEPRFLPSGRLGRVGGRKIPPASSAYLE